MCCRSILIKTALNLHECTRPMHPSNFAAKLLFAAAQCQLPIETRLPVATAQPHSFCKSRRCAQTPTLDGFGGVDFQPALRSRILFASPSLPEGVHRHLDTCISLLYILILRTSTKFVWKPKMLKDACIPSSECKHFLAFYVSIRIL